MYKNFMAFENENIQINTTSTNRVKKYTQEVETRLSSWNDIKQEKLNHMWEAVEGGKDGNSPDLATIFFETRKKCNKLVEPKVIEKYVRLVN
ncbi:hypothetical protein H5410_028810 [Solanum commersonii]|uniref:Uncharacterized protein n=1 Tax=Solanum commersonii TaxID=4109 RepID=A0A9J5Z8N5_SOLCO|nr:hypothetical protein H5410_028810 [Solanum commersonii]